MEEGLERLRENGSGGVRLERDGREASDERAQGRRGSKVGEARESCGWRRRRWEEERTSLRFSDEAKANRIRGRVR